MGTNWTSDQEKVLKARNKEILVAAAAGSGKTAVLVERVIRMITDKTNPVDIDRLLILTFTRAAAAEMKGRIIAALEARLEDENLSDSEVFNLQRQALLANCANIGTIDSFFQSVVRDNFNEIGLEPSFRVASEKELNIIKNNAMKEVLDAAYEDEEREDFFDFIEEYADKKTDKNIEEIVYQLYLFSRSHTEPEKWLDDCEENYDIERYKDTAWFNYMKKDIEKSLEKMLENYQNAVLYLKDVKGSTIEKHRLFIQDELTGLEKIINKDFDITILDELKDYKEYISTKGTIRPSKDEDDGKALSLRKDSIAILKKICEKYCNEAASLQLDNIKASKKSTKELIRITKEFARTFKEKKMERNLVDFSDLGHYALDILVEGYEKDGRVISSDIAKEISERFDEIIVDEYQDTNYIQEAVLDAVSKKHKEIYNIFRVGDVKQSIYKFRLAKPELFVEKYDDFLDSDIEGAENYLIKLDKNFRSRKEVIDAVNAIFNEIMIKDFGGVDYSDGNKLKFGFEDYLALPDKQDNKAEFVFIDSCGQKTASIEAAYIAKRIEEMMEEGFVIMDKKNKCLKCAGYGDIAVLYRTKANMSALKAELSARNIPYYCDTAENLYEKREVNVFADFLRLIDNPNNDIALTSVLKSEIVGLSSEELARIRLIDKEKPFFKLVLDELPLSEDESLKEIKEAVNKLNDKLEKYRDFELHNSVKDLMHYALTDSGFYDFLSAMTDGNLKIKNLERFENLAKEYESFGEGGLFSFLQYFDEIVKNKESIKAAMPANTNEDAVKIMTIHSSKGLEFPICFVADTGKSFNNQDSTNKIALHDEMGIGVDYMDSGSRLKSTTFIKKAIADRVTADLKEEEIRLLYVAMTRAEEKLIVIATDKNMSSAGKVNDSGKAKKGGKFEKWNKKDHEAELSAVDLAEANSYADWIGMVSAINGGVNSETSEGYKIDMDYAYFVFERFEDMIKAEVEDIVDSKALKEEFKSYFIDKSLKTMPLEGIKDDASHEEAKEAVSLVNREYKYKNDLDLKTKMSVSEIKKMSYHFAVEEDAFIPEFVKNNTNNQEEKKASGTERGSAYHRVFELLDLKSIKSEKDLEENIEEMLDKGLISKEWTELVNKDKVLTFVNSDIAKRMAKAQENNMLFRERPYVMGVSAKEIDDKYSADEMVLVQGIIDAYFEEDGKIVIVDYKTDRVKKMEELSDRYKVQLDYYEKAIAQVTGKEVSEKVIYSVAFGKSMEV